MNYTKAQQKRIKEAIKISQSLFKKHGCGVFSDWLLLPELDKNLFGITPKTKTIIKSKKSIMINTSNIIPFYWSGRKLLAW